MVLNKINPINEAAFDSARSAVKKAAGFIHNTGSPRQAGSPTSQKDTIESIVDGITPTENGPYNAGYTPTGVFKCTKP